MAWPRINPTMIALVLATGACNDAPLSQNITPPELSPSATAATSTESAAGASIAGTSVGGFTTNEALRPKNALRLPTRLALGPSGHVYVTDAAVGSVFILDSKTLTPIAELKSVGRPLGVAVDSKGTIFVGCAKAKAVLRYDVHGNKTGVIGAGSLSMPNDIALDRRGVLYVADSSAHRVRAFWPSGRALFTIGEKKNELRFPAAVDIHYEGKARDARGELYIADQGQSKIRVYDLSGKALRAFGARLEQLSPLWRGRFGKLQSVVVDALGRVHAADTHTNRMQILDGKTGAFIDAYGTFGRGKGKVFLPLDLLIATDGRVLVANAENKRVDAHYTVPQGGRR